MHFLFSAKLEKNIGGKLCTKKLSCRVILFFCGKCVYKKMVKSCNFFFAAMPVTGLHNLPQKKIQDVAIFFCYTHLPQKKITRITTYTTQHTTLYYI